MFFAFCVPGKFWNLFLRSEQKLAKLPCRRILLSQTVEEAFEAVGLILPVGFDRLWNFRDGLNVSQRITADARLYWWNWESLRN